MLDVMFKKNWAYVLLKIDSQSPKNILELSREVDMNYPHLCNQLQRAHKKHRIVNFKRVGNGYEVSLTHKGVEVASALLKLIKAIDLPNDYEHEEGENATNTTATKSKTVQNKRRRTE